MWFIRGGSKNHFVHIFLNIDQFSHLFTSRLCKEIATQWRAQCTWYVLTLPCKTLSSKFLIESTGEKIVKIGHYLATVWKIVK